MEINNPVFKMVLIVIALLALLFVAVQLSKHPVSPTKNSMEDKKKTVQISPVDYNKLPDKFPTDLPLEDGANITQNFNATEVDGRYNATREFNSAKTLAQNIAVYTKYLKTNDWQVKATIDQPALKMVMGQKGNQQLQVVAAQNPTTKANVITITLTEFKK